VYESGRHVWATEYDARSTFLCRVFGSEVFIAAADGAILILVLSSPGRKRLLFRLVFASWETETEAHQSLMNSFILRRDPEHVVNRFKLEPAGVVFQTSA
jgi:hypothetical protein